MPLLLPLLIANLPALPFEKYQLDNGLTVILHRDARTPLIAVNVSYDVGSLHERTDRSGFAHLFEHMMFQKSAHVGEDRYFQILVERGATEINGTTGFDRTVYFETVPSHELELALWAESDRMGFLLAALDQKTLDNQKQVVRSERRTSVVDRPYGLIDELVVRRVFPAPHPYHGNVIGIPETIEAATLDDVREFFATFYTPANARLTLAGDFEPAIARALVSKYFSTLAGRPRPPLLEIEPPRLTSAIAVHAREPIALRPRVTMVWIGPRLFEPGTAELDMIAGILDDDQEAVLRRELVNSGVDAAEVSARFSENRAGSTFRIDVVLERGADLERTVEQVDRVLELLRRIDVWEERLTEIIGRHERALLLNLQRLQTRAHVLGLYDSLTGDPGSLERDLARYRAVTPGGIKEAIRSFLDGRRLVVFAEPERGAIRKR